MSSGHPPDLILLYQATTTGPGLAIGAAMQMRYGVPSATKPNQNQFSKYMKIFGQIADSAAGASTALQFQTSPDNSTWTTVHTRTLTIPAAGPFIASIGNGDGMLFKFTAQFVRINVLSLAGGVAPKVNAYCTWGAYGA